MGESTITVRTGVALSEETPLRLKLKIFEEIGIPVPHLKLVSSEVAGASGPHPHVSKLAFVGVTENDLKKIRGWLVRNEIQRRK